MSGLRPSRPAIFTLLGILYVLIGLADAVAFFLAPEYYGNIVMVMLLAGYGILTYLAWLGGLFLALLGFGLLRMGKWAWYIILLLIIVSFASSIMLGFATNLPEYWIATLASALTFLVMLATRGKFRKRRAY